MSKRIFLCFIFSLLISLLLWGCGDGSETEDSLASTSSESEVKASESGEDLVFSEIEGNETPNVGVPEIGVPDIGAPDIGEGSAGETTPSDPEVGETPSPDEAVSNDTTAEPVPDESTSDDLPSQEGSASLPEGDFVDGYNPDDSSANSGGEVSTVDPDTNMPEVDEPEIGVPEVGAPEISEPEIDASSTEPSQGTDIIFPDEPEDIYVSEEPIPNEPRPR